MKKAFTVYVPDGCHLKMLNATILVEKNDGSNNGITVFTQGENDITENNVWLFQIKGNAIRVSEVAEVREEIKKAYEMAGEKYE